MLPFTKKVRGKPGSTPTTYFRNSYSLSKILAEIGMNTYGGILYVYPFHTHSVGTIKHSGSYFGYHPSEEDILRLRRLKASIGILVTPYQVIISNSERILRRIDVKYHSVQTGIKDVEIDRKKYTIIWMLQTL